MILEAAVALGVFAMALVRMAPGIALEDSGEFVTAAATLTLTHPPGYPLYLLGGRLVALLPCGSPAFRLSLLSAGCIALTAAVVARCARTRFGAGPAAAVMAGCAVAGAPAAALQALLADKYPLHLLLTAGVLLVLWRSGTKPDRRWPVLGLVGGLALSHHLMTVYLGPALIAQAWRDRIWRTPRIALVALLLAVTGFSVKPVTLPALSLHAPSLLYGPLDRAATLRRYLAARDYEERFTAYPLEEKLARVLTRSVPELATQAGAPVLLLALAGAGALPRLVPGALAGATGGILIAIGLVASFQIAGTGYYLLPVVIFAALAAAAALGRLERAGWRRLAGALALLVATHAATRGWRAADLSRYLGAEDWGRNLLAGLAPGGVLVSRHDDDFYPPMYRQRVWNERADIALIHRPFITKLWHHARVEELRPGFMVLDRGLLADALAAGDGATLRPPEIINLFMRSHFDRRDLAWSYLAVEECAGGFQLTPHGPVFRITRPPSPARRAGPGVEGLLPTADRFGASLRRFRWRHLAGPWAAGSRFAEVAGAPATSWTQLSLRWWALGKHDEARACMRQALRLPYTRVVRADLERVAGVMGF